MSHPGFGQVLLLAGLPVNSLQCAVVKARHQHVLVADPATNKAGESQHLPFSAQTAAD